MPGHFKVTDLLSPEDSKRFQSLMADARTTVNGAHAWMLTRGYTISRTAIGNYMRDQKAQSMTFPRIRLALKGDADTRRKLAKYSKRLDGNLLAGLTMYAAFLVSASRGIRTPVEQQ